MGLQRQGAVFKAESRIGILSKAERKSLKLNQAFKHRGANKDRGQFKAESSIDVLAKAGRQFLNLN